MDIKGILKILREDLPDCQIETCRRNFALEGEEEYWGNVFYVFREELGTESAISDILMPRLKESGIHTMAKILRGAFNSRIIQDN